jgi:hypothetical protein
MSAHKLVPITSVEELFSFSPDMPALLTGGGRHEAFRLGELRMFIPTVEKTVSFQNGKIKLAYGSAALYVIREG